MHTEDEAREKWCPFARYYSKRWGTVQNRWVDDDVQLNPEPARCIASDCMAWRWERHVGPAAASIGMPAERTGRGYCGLAGDLS